MLALEYETAKNVAIGLIVLFVVLALVAASVIRNVTGKVTMVIILAGLALGVWTQRQSLQDCSSRVRDKASVGDYSDTTCTFFGSDIEVPGVRNP